MRRTVATSVALALGLAPVAVARPAPAPARPDPVAVRAEAHERLLRRIPQLAPREARTGGPSAQATVYSVAELWRAGDIDGDRSEEVVDVRLHMEEKPGGELVESVLVNVHRGRDGKLLWGRTLTGVSFAFPIPTKVGPTGAPGLVIAGYQVNYTDAALVYGAVLRTSVAAYDAKGGAVWDASFDGGFAGGPVSAISATFVDGVLDANPGGGMEVLVTQATGMIADAGPGYASGSTGTPVILDGVTGDPRPLTPVPSTSPDPMSAAVGDLDGDRRADVVVTGNAGPTNTLTALRSSDGRVLWTCTELPPAMVGYPSAVPDATGDGVGDVLVSTGFFAAPPSWDVIDPHVSLVDGKSGALRWSEEGIAGYSLGRDVDRAAGAEVVVGDFVTRSTEFGVRFTAFNAAGKAVWSARRTVAVDPRGDGELSASLGLAGDTDGDGVLDPVYRVRLRSFVNQENSGTLDGRTGRPRRDPVPDMVALALPVDGRGSDAVVVARTKPGLAVSAWRGDTGKRLWQATIPLPASAGRPFPSGLAFYADRDRCADVVVGGLASGHSTTDYVLSGATGKALWALTRSGLGAPRVTRPVLPGQRRFVRTC